MTVKATREGLLGSVVFNPNNTVSITGKPTTSGYIPDRAVPFVALPSHKALGLAVRVTNPVNNKSIIAIVLDVGPWNEHDDSYVFAKNRPQAERGIDKTGRKTNLAGIDLSEKVWNALDMKDNTEVEWEFVS